MISRFFSSILNRFNSSLPARYAVAITILLPGAASGSDIVATKAYRWTGDSIIQGPFKAYAPTPFRIVSDYSAQPGYYMGVEKEWNLKNDISEYPQLTTSNTLHNAM